MFPVTYHLTPYLRVASDGAVSERCLWTDFGIQHLSMIDFSLLSRIWRSLDRTTQSSSRPASPGSEDLKLRNRTLNHGTNRVARRKRRSYGYIDRPMGRWLILEIVVDRAVARFYLPSSRAGELMAAPIFFWSLRGFFSKTFFFSSIEARRLPPRKSYQYTNALVGDRSARAENLSELLRVAHRTFRVRRWFAACWLSWVRGAGAPPISNDRR